MANEDEEVAALDRVLTRTVLTKDEDLQQVGHAAVYTMSMCVIASPKPD
jgi:hypothetical protein